MREEEKPLQNSISEKVFESTNLDKRIEVRKFFELFAEYRRNCRNKPWLTEPKEAISDFIKANFEKWRRASFEIYPKHPFRQPEDKNLIDQAVSLLANGYEGVKWEFQHGHLSDSDLYKVGNEVVVLSNLYWSFRPPFYDYIFAYHWFRYHLSDVAKTPEEVEEQKKIWLDHITALPETRSSENQRLLKLALLERAAAGLNLDALSMKTKTQIGKYLVDSTREEVERLIEELS